MHYLWIMRFLLVLTALLVVFFLQYACKKGLRISEVFSEELISDIACDSTYKSIISFSTWTVKHATVSGSLVWDDVTEYFTIYELIDSIVEIESNLYYAVKTKEYNINTLTNTYNGYQEVRRSDTSRLYNYIREDYCSKKVFYYYRGNDCLLYNFNVKLNDSLMPANSCARTTKLFISTIDSVTIDEKYYSRTNFKYKDSDKYPYFWIEGIGSAYGLFEEEFVDFVPEWGFYFVSFRFNGIKVN